MLWSIEKILGLAPDASSAKAGQGLATPRKWVSLGVTERALWGECQGSGAKPYQVQIDLSEPAFKCSCPSRKFPCKHALGLFLLLSPKIGSPEGTPPQWVTDWIQSREDKLQKKKEKAEEPTAIVDPEAQAKRAGQRLNKITAGIHDLQIWMDDIVRQGLAQAQTAGEKIWEQPAARMVDAQAPGLARIIRQLSETVGGERWQERLLAGLSRLYLLCQAWERLDTLPPEMQADVKSLVGIPIREEELLASEGIVDHWCIVAQRTEEEERLRTQRSWLIGERTDKAAMILEFAYAGQPLKSLLVCGTTFEAEMVFYPGAAPLRAAIKSRQGETRDLPALKGHASITNALNAYADALSKNPWLDPFPLLLSNSILSVGDSMLAIDPGNRAIHIKPDRNQKWEMLAMTGGRPATLFGEWNGHSLDPMAIWCEGVFHALG